MVTELPSNVNYGYVVGRILLAVADSADADRYPDGLPAEGTVTFTPSVAYVINATAAPDAAMIIPKPIVCTIDSDGYLLGPDGARGVWLVATDDPDNNPVNWTYAVTYRLTGATIPAYSIAVPMAATLLSPLHLPTVAPVISSPGIGIPAAEAAAAAAAGAASTAANAALEAAISADEARDLIALGIPGPPGSAGTNATITGATATALAAGASPTVTAGGTPSARSFAFGIPRGANGNDGTNGVNRFLIQSGASYPARPDASPVVFVGTANPDTLGVMSVGDTWIDTSSGGTPNLVSTVAGRSGDVVLTKTDVGLANIDNTSDVNKPVSTATTTAIANAVAPAIFRRFARQFMGSGTNQPITNNTLTRFTQWTATGRDDGNAVPGGLTYANGVLTVQTAGVYSSFAQVLWDSHATGTRDVFLAINDAEQVSASTISGSVVTAHHGTAFEGYLNAGATIEVKVTQNCGATLNVRALNPYTIWSAVYIGPR